MKAIKLLNRFSLKFCYNSVFVRLMSQSVDNTLINSESTANCVEIDVQNNNEVIKEKTETEDKSELSAKGLKREDQSVEGEVQKRQRKEKPRKWVLLLSYCGHGYYGMQRQTQDNEFPTIEYRLFESLWKNGIVGEDVFRGQHLCRFQRAARTDKGVSAIKQIVSVLLPTNFAELIPKVNELLPKQIQVMDALRVTKFFDAKNFCDGRTYSYLMPSYALCPVEQKTCQSFRLSAESLKEFNEILSPYLGTHNYHNFTANKAPTDASAMRYIMAMSCSQPFIRDDIEFVVVRVKGQSFMLHQIRKMIGLAIAIMRGLTDKETIGRAFNPTRIDIPKAPGLGLLLEEVHYDRYNEKYGGDGIHDPITWEHKNDTIDDFKHKHIYPVIVETERNEMPMFEWLQTLVFHTYDEREQRPNEPLGKPTHTPEDRPYLHAFMRAKSEGTVDNCEKTTTETENSCENEFNLEVNQN